ncbi:MAG: AI-2E family transporter [Anaerolineales bacterium]|nr:AI-2E family transporter [Anaerolineales bacterium]MCB9128818.1 AI-2E family transporter [Ardenticatenales bacterium]
MMQTLRKPRLILSIVVFLIVFTMLWQARAVLLPFAIALVVGYVLSPLVNWFEARMPREIKGRKMARGVAIILVYILVAILLYLFGRALLEPLIAQLVAFINNLPALFNQIIALATDALEQYQRLLAPEWQNQIEQQIGSYDATTLLTPIVTALRTALGAVTGVAASLLGLIILPFWLFFILSDESSVIRGLIKIVPHEWRPDVEAIRIIVDQVLGAYLRGQLAVAAILGLLITIGLTLIKVQYALLLGVAAALFALVPFAGAFLGAVPALLVSFLDDPQKGVLTLILFIVVQQIDNIFISPKVIGDAVALHPALIILVLLIGGTLFGVPGALIAVPGTAMLRDIVRYLYLRADENREVLPTMALAKIGYESAITREMTRYERQRQLPMGQRRRLQSVERAEEKETTLDP